MGLGMKNFDILGAHWKIQLLHGGSSQKTREKEGVVVFEWGGGGCVDTPSAHYV